MEMALTFNDVKLDVVDHNGTPWFQARQIGEALGYSRSDAILNIYDRNKDEFTIDMTTTIELMVGATPQKTRIFSPRGCHLLAMFARTPIAKEFRKWVLDVLERISQKNEKDAKREDCESATITPEQQWTLRNIVDAKVFEITGGSGPQRSVFYMQIWNRFKNHFRLAKYDQLPQSRIAEAISYLVRMEVEEKAVGQQEELPKAEPVSPYQAYLEEVEKVRQKTMIEMSRLMSMGLNLLDVYKFTTSPYRTFTHVLNDWLARVIVQPSPIESNEQFDNSSPVALIRELSAILPSLRK